ncbi:DDE_3 domain-containing protein [Trichonephila clavipes]|nr:DDE_3 domain-containing protein [Trichonephila clavipes]
MCIVFSHDDGIYQQDSVKCHTDGSVRAWFKEHQDEFTILPRQANSPDLNPINNLLHHLYRVAHVMDPHSRNLVQLAKAMESVWLNIPGNIFTNLIDSLAARLAAVYSAKSGYSGF